MKKKLTLDEMEVVIREMQLTEQEQGCFFGGGDGSKENPFTQEEYHNLLETNNWRGGYVEDLGYVFNDIFIYGNSAWPNFDTEQNYYTLSEYLATNELSVGDQIADFILSAIPLFGLYYQYYSTQFNNMKSEMQQALADQGYSGNKRFNLVYTKVDDNSFSFTAYDAEDSHVIVSRTLNITGCYY